MTVEQAIQSAGVGGATTQAILNALEGAGYRIVRSLRNDGETPDSQPQRQS